MIFALFILFFLFPLPILLYAIPRIRDWRYRTVILMFYLMTAWMLIPYEYGDIRLYGDQILKYNDYTWYEYLVEFARSLIGQGNVGTELFVELNLFLTSRITTYPNLAYCITATVVFLAWQAIVMRLIKDYDEENKKLNLIAIGLIFCFAIYVIFVRAINGRFYIAYWIFAYAFYKVIVDRKFKYHYLLLATIYIHQSFIFLNALVVLYRLTERFQKNKKFEYILFGLLIIAIAFSSSAVSLITENMGLLGDSYSNKYDAYLSEHYMDKVDARDRRWFMEYRTVLLFYALAGNVLWARFSKRIVFDLSTIRLYYFSLIFWVINAFTIEVESFGDRFRNVLMGVFLILLFKIYNTNKVKFIPVNLIILTFAFALYKIVTIRVLAGYLDVWILTPLSMVFSAIFGPVPLQS